MSRPTDRNRFQNDAEAKFPCRLDVPVPGSGLGHRLTDMHAWRRVNVARGEWAEHSHAERRKGEKRGDFARFYFMCESDTEAFRRAWGL
jgi:hypothetical protein